MNKELTYEEAINFLTHICGLSYEDYKDDNTQGQNFRNRTVFEIDYKALKKIEEAIEKAEKYDLLAKEEGQ